MAARGCWHSITRCISNRADEPQRTRYRTEAVESIKFENLLTVERREKETHRPLLTDEEAQHIREGRMDRLEEELRKEDMERDAQLRLQEEALKREEEAYYAAKREAARKSRQIKQSSRAAPPLARAGQNTLLAAQNMVLSPNESVTTSAHTATSHPPGEEEEDFDKFLENIKAKQSAMSSTKVAIASDSEEEVDFGYWEKATSATSDGVRGAGNLLEVDLNLL